MTDRDRAEDFMGRYTALGGDALRMATDALAARFAATRRDERTAIVTYMRNLIDGRPPADSTVDHIIFQTVDDTLANVARRIEQEADKS